jgi:transposase
MNDPAIKRQENNPPHPGSENAPIMRETQKDTKLRRSQASKHNFQNPQYRESVLTRLRSLEFQAKAKIARAKRFKEDPDIFKRAAKTKWKHKLEQLKQLLGGDPKEVLEDLHLKHGLSQKDIAHRFHKTPVTVNHWFKRFGITTNLSISAKTNRKRYADQLAQLLGGDLKEVLEDLHIKQQLPMNAIAHRYHIHPNTVSRWFKRLGIVTIPYKSHKTGGSINSEVRELVLRAIKNGSFEKLPQRGKDLLTLRYLQTGKPLTLEEIAEKMGGISRQRVHELEKTTLHYLQVNKTPEEARLRHIQNMKNPEYRKRVLAKLHSPEAKRRT